MLVFGAQAGQMMRDELKVDEMVSILRHDWFQKTPLHEKSLPGWETANDNMHVLAQHGGYAIRSGIEAVLASVVMHAWTTFEVVAGDLWTEAALLRPDPIARATFPKNFPPDRETVEKTARQRMRRLEGIHARYRESFGATDTAPLLGAQDFLNMWVLEGVRNALVHKGGRVDGMFLTRVAEHSAEYRLFNLHFLREGQEIPITGRLVKDIAGSALSAAAALIIFVNNWFTVHP
jgi:hypothetical protein